MRHDWMTFAERPVPRYTSYPTAADFSPAVDECDAAVWAARTNEREAISVYVHVPFCEKLCWYCACATSVPNGYDRVANYVGVLHQEIDLWVEALGDHGGLKHLHFGGGSPNALSCEDFTRLIRHLSDAFRLQPGAEIAVELDPRLVSTEQLQAMAASGVTRASLGVQTLSPRVQAAINRVQPRAMVADVAKTLRREGVHAVNMDLMYGLPHQEVEDGVEAARFAIEHGAARISVFGYAHVPWFAKHQRAINEAALPGLAQRFEQAAAIGQTLTDAGYVAIGLDHYARADDALAAASGAGTLRRNFQGYTDDPCATLVGLGPTSISQFTEGYAQNHKDRRVWRESVHAGHLPTMRGIMLTDGDRVRAAAIERLMCDMVVDVAQVCRDMGAPIGMLDPCIDRARLLEAAGLCAVVDEQIAVPEEARVMLRTVAQVFDAREPVSAAPRHAKAV